VDKEDRGYIILYFLVELDEPLEPLPNWRRARSGE